MDDALDMDDVGHVVCSFEVDGKPVTKHLAAKLTPRYKSRKVKKQSKKANTTNSTDLALLEKLDQYIDKIIHSINASKAL